MIDRYLLRYFLAVVDQGNFSRAAQQCNVSQPTLSVGIAKLERELGERLFLRSNQRVELTAAGARFLDHARRIEREFNLAQAAMGMAVEAPVLRLGVLRSISSASLAAAIAACGDGLGKIELIDGTERELAARLARGRIDAALTLVGRGDGRFAEEALAEEGYRLALPAGHPLAAQSSIEAEALADNVMIVRRHCEMLSETSRHFTERGVRPHFAFRSTDDDRVLAWVEAGLGITVIPESLARRGIATPRLAGFGQRRTIGFAWPAGAVMPPGAPLIDHLRREIGARLPDR